MPASEHVSKKEPSTFPIGSCLVGPTAPTAKCSADAIKDDRNQEHSPKQIQHDDVPSQYESARMQARTFSEGCEGRKKM